MTPIAIVGMACIFPGAGSLDAYWRNIESGFDAITDVPPGRWEPSFYDPASKAPDRFYCRRGGFVDADASFDPLEFGVMPKAVASAEPEQWLALRVGQAALRDAGGAGDAAARERAGVIIGRGNYPGAGVLRLEQRVRLVPQIVQTLRDLWPDAPADVWDAARTRLEAQLVAYGPDVAGDLIPNLVASRLAHRLGLQGAAYTVDAACASALVAVEQACRALDDGRADLMLAGGVHLSHDLTLWATFCQLGAMSRHQSMRPLAADADGILAGEGIGFVVLRRLDDALAAGERIYAAIEGIGTSSDGAGSGLLAPASAGQRLALQRAWSRRSMPPRTIGLLEAHGTGTPAGDAAELETVAAFFGRFQGSGERPVIGSVKSMIGHTMPASGMAGLIKTALAVHHGVLPPTLHCEQPHPRLAETAFRTIGRAEAWNAAPEKRVAAVNAFGFGGINAHVVLRGRAMTAKLRATVPAAAPPALRTLSADSPAELLARFDRGERDPASKPGACRFLMFDADDPRRRALAREAIAGAVAWQGRQQIWFSPRGLLAGGGKLAFVFPGVDHRFAPQAHDLASHFGRPLPRFCAEPMDPGARLAPVVLGLLGFNRFMFETLDTLGVRADAMAGHSVGEWSAMLAAGLLDQAFSERTNEALDADALKFPPLQFLAAHCDAGRLLLGMGGIEGVALSHDNCPHQAIACGSAGAIDVLAARLRDAGVAAHRLPFASGMHSPLFAPHAAWYRRFFAEAPFGAARVPVWSATSAAPFPAAESAQRQLAVDHLLQPVRFRLLIESMYEAGFRVFVQVGTGSTCGFVDDTLERRPHLALQGNVERLGGLEQLRRTLAALWVEGAAVDPAALAGGAPGAAPGDAQPLALGVPLLRVAALEGVALAAAAPAVPMADPIGRQVHELLGEIGQASREVVALWQRRRVATALDLRLQRRIEPVIDHQLYPQRAGWPILADGCPVMPLTMELALVMQAAEQSLPGRRACEARELRASAWLEVAAPRDIEITLRSRADGAIDAAITGFFEAVLLTEPCAAASALPALVAPREPAVDAAALYAERWMFHGPAYQGVESLGPIGDNGIDGRLRATAGEGALLDAMGQLAGYWVMEQPDNCLAMPVAIDRVRFFGDAMPALGERLSCAVRIDALDALACSSSHRLVDARGKLRIAIDGWRTRRYVMDKAFWERSRDLAHREVVQWLAPGVALFDDRYDSANLRVYIARRFLTASERTVYDGLPPGRRRHWLAGRVAAKDAVRGWLRRHRGLQAIHPQEIVIGNDEAGAPFVTSPITNVVPSALRLSIAHKDTLALAAVAAQPVGVDVERLVAADAGFADIAFSAIERERLPAHALTQGWVAKEVVAKLDGRGLGGRLRELVVEAYDGAQLRINGHDVITCRVGEYVVGWSGAT